MDSRILVCYILFNFFLAISAIGCIFLFFTFCNNRGNPLIPSVCVCTLILIAVVVLGNWATSYQMDKLPYGICTIQAILMNYLQLAIHFHLGLLMLDHCLVAYDYPFSGGKRRFVNNCFLICYGFPLIPTVILVILRLINFSNFLIHPTHFYCTVLHPLSLSNFWMGLMGLFGTGAAVMFGYKVMVKRVSTMALGTNSQFSKATILRLIAAIYSYTFLALTFSIPAVIRRQADIRQHIIGTKIPKIDIDFLTFGPSLIGISLFLMYGFSTRAIKMYKTILSKINSFIQTKKRNRVAPMTNFECECQFDHQPATTTTMVGARKRRNSDDFCIALTPPGLEESQLFGTDGQFYGDSESSSSRENRLPTLENDQNQSNLSNNIRNRNVTNKNRNNLLYSQNVGSEPDLQASQDSLASDTNPMTLSAWLYDQSNNREQSQNTNSHHTTKNNNQNSQNTNNNWNFSWALPPAAVHRRAIISHRPHPAFIIDPKFNLWFRRNSSPIYPLSLEDLSNNFVFNNPQEIHVEEAGDDAALVPTSTDMAKPIGNTKAEDSLIVPNSSELILLDNNLNNPDCNFENGGEKDGFEMFPVAAKEQDDVHDHTAEDVDKG